MVRQLRSGAWSVVYPDLVPVAGTETFEVEECIYLMIISRDWMQEDVTGAT